MNLNKYTKAELISKLKNIKPKLEAKNSITEKIISKLLLFKSLIIKITLITFIITWFKKYSLIKKLWHLFSVIGSALFGLSLVDIYSLDFINWLKDTNIYKWYSELFNIQIVNNSKTEIKEPSSILRANNTNSITNETRNERDYEIIKRLQEIIHKDKDPVIIQIDEIDEDVPFFKNKYFIIGAASVTCLIGWYYFDEIKTGYGAIIDYLSSFRPGPPDDPAGSNSSGSAISDKLNIKSKLDKSRKSLLAKLLGELMAEYDVQTITYKRQVPHLSQHDIINTRQSFFHFRQWIEKYSNIILEEHHKPFDIGNINDTPKMIYSIITN